MKPTHMKLSLLAIATLLTLTACPPAPVAPPPDAADASPPGTPDAAPQTPQDASADADPPQPPKDLYEAACGRLAKVGCPEAAQVDGGKTCADVLRANALLYDLRLQCVALAATPAEVRGCCPTGDVHKPGMKVCGAVKCTVK